MEKIETESSKKKRREFLVSHIKGKQIIITCTDIEEGFEEKNIIKIKDGEVIKG